jgi:hypothetical protein
MANHEERPIIESVDLFLAFSRKKDGMENRKCIRTIIRDYNLDLEILKTKLKLLGGEWRIHKTVNKRDVQKARMWLIHKLLDNPEFAGCIDSLWRTSLLQKECIYGEQYFLLDVDTKKEEELIKLNDLIPNIQETLDNIIETPNGYHYITKKFDTREVCNLPYVTLIRDGYLFIEKLGGLK